MIKKIFWLFIWSIIALFSLWLVFAQSSVDPMNLPKINQYVMDYSNTLDQSILQQLSSLWEAYNLSTSNQLVVVLFPNRNWNELFNIAMKVFEDNAIGQAWKNNGLLLLIATEEKKIRILVWYGLEWSMPDALASRIIEEDIRPLVNSGDFTGAIQKFYERSILAIDTGEWKDYQTSTNSLIWKSNDSVWFIGLILWFILASFIKSKSLKNKWFKKYLIFIITAITIALVIWLSVTILIGVIAGLIFAFTGFMPGRGGGMWWFGWWGFGWGGFSWWGGSSGWGGAGD